MIKSQHQNVPLIKISLQSLARLIEESDRAFLAPTDNPTQTTSDLIRKFQNDPLFQPLGYKVNNTPISYVLAIGNKQPNTISLGPMYVSHAHQKKGDRQKAS